MTSEIYFDNNATTRVRPEVFEALAPYYAEFYGNPSSIHRFGSQVSHRLSEARVQVASLIGAADPVEVIFTSCGTEGDNAAIRGLLEMRPDKRQIITTQVEHPAILGLCQHLEKKGYRVTWLGVDQDGMLDLDELREALTDETALVSIMFANNETGVIFPIEQIGEIVKSKGVPFHVDAVQAAGKLPIDVKNSPVDLMTLSAHKFHGPKGVGALYVRRGLTFPPFIIGGHQERSRRAGTENVAGIVGMGKAAELALKNQKDDSVKIRALRDQLQDSLLEACPSARVNGDKVKRLPNTLNISFRYLEGESILVLLDQHGICASTGSACTAGSSEPSHVLRAMRTPADWLQGAVRFSLSRFNTEDEVRFINEKMPSIVKRLEGLSALGKLAAQERKTPGSDIPAASQQGGRL
ncbi:MAG TPA: cysteine desulfurase NifS [Candidatus Binatia bacterium]|nr:cysteine desulfurase NifS [Candidatus Binatia bacterium]